MLIIPLYELCAANAELTRLLSDDVGLKVSEFNANNINGAPYVCWQIINANTEQYLSESSDMDSLYVQIDIYAVTKDLTRQISKLLRTVIEDFSSITSYSGVEHDPEVNLYRIRIDSRWLEEP